MTPDDDVEGGDAVMAVTDEAIEKIKAMIVSGELKPGDRLPVEKILASRLGLSRNSLREAVRALGVLRVLETRQGAGTFVTSLAPGLVLEAVSFIVNFHDPATAIHFLEVRRLLDSEAAARRPASTPRRTTSASCAALNDRLREVAAAVPFDPARMIELDREFHSRIAATCGNPALGALADMLGGQTAPARTLRLVARDTTAATSIAEHDGIVDAIEERDVERARLRAATHVLALEDWLESQVEHRSEARRPPAQRDGPAGRLTSRGRARATRRRRAAARPTGSPRAAAAAADGRGTPGRPPAG